MLLQRWRLTKTKGLLPHSDDSYVGAGLPVALKDKRRFWHRFLVATCYLLYEHSRRLAHLVLEHHTYASDSDSSSGSGSNRGSGGGHADHGIPGPLQPDDTPLTGQPYHAFTLRPEPWWLFGREVDADWKEFFEYAYWVEALVDDDNYSDCWTDSGRGRERPERPGRPANGGGSRWPSSVASSSTMHDSAGSQHGDEAPTPFTVPDEDGDSDGDDDSNDVEMPDKPGSGSSGGGRDDGCSDYDRSSSSSDDGDDGDDDDGTRDVIHRTATEANVVSVSTLRCLHEALTELRHVLRADGASSDAPDADRHLLHESFCYFMERRSPPPLFVDPRFAMSHVPLTSSLRLLLLWLPRAGMGPEPRPAVAHCHPQRQHCLSADGPAPAGAVQLYFLGSLWLGLWVWCSRFCVCVRALLCSVGFVFHSRTWERQPAVMSR